MIMDLRSTPMMTLSLASFEIVLRHHLAVLTRGDERRFIHQIGEIGAGESGCSAGEHHQIDIVGERRLLGMHSQNLLAPLHIRTAHHYAPVEAAGAQ